MKNLLAVISISIGCLSFSQTPGSGVTDFDGNSYSTVIIGSQEWMSENLRTTHYSNGDEIPNVTNHSEWISLTSDAWCYYDNDSQFDLPYGKLYNGYVITNDKNVCPVGWHIPDSLEFDILIDFLGGANVAGGKMKTTGTIEDSDGLWNSPNEGATNSSEFSAVPSGWRLPHSHSTEFHSLGVATHLWACNRYSEEEMEAVAEIHLYNYDGKVQPDYSSINYGYPIRCLKGESSSCQSLKIEKLEKDNPELVKIIDLMGRTVEQQFNVMQIYIYSDGTAKKVLRVE